MAFKKSSKCESWACVEVDVEPAVFRKSSRCATSTCVEVASASPVLVRDSKLPHTAPLLAFSPQAWTAFTSSRSV